MTTTLAKTESAPGPTPPYQALITTATKKRGVVKISARKGYAIKAAAATNNSAIPWRRMDPAMSARRFDRRLSDATFVADFAGACIDSAGINYLLVAVGRQLVFNPSKEAVGSPSWD
jgi:hypothetical protein